MHKAELIEAVASSTELSKAETNRVVSSVFETITDQLEKGESVIITGFGSFNVNKRQARTGRNPQTGEELQIPARKAPVFRAGKALKSAVEGKRKS